MGKEYKATRELLAALEWERDRWQRFLNQEIPQMLASALQLGDPSNNAEYEFVMDEKKACIERITQYEAILSHAVIVNEDGTEEPYPYMPRKGAR